MKTNLPTYLDGRCQVYKIEDSDDLTPKEILKDEKLELWFEEISIFDKLRYELSAKDIELTFKLRIDQCKQITSKHVLKIDDNYHKVYNIAHFTNKDGFKQSDITLLKYEVTKT